MKVTKKQLDAIKSFEKDYIDRRYKPQWNVVKFSSTSYEHQRTVFDVCWWLYKNNIPFATETVFTSGYNPDIICPTHIKPVIEVRYSEKDKNTIEKFSRIPEELHNKIIFVDANKTFDEKDLL
jgi:hypothetical protein